MTKIQLHVAPDQTPQEEAELVAKVAAAIAESTGTDTVHFELVKSEQMSVNGTVADRMAKGARWSA